MYTILTILYTKCSIIMPFIICLAKYIFQTIRKKRLPLVDTSHSNDMQLQLRDLVTHLINFMLILMPFFHHCMVKATFLATQSVPVVFDDHRFNIAS